MAPQLRGVGTTVVPTFAPTLSPTTLQPTTAPTKQPHPNPPPPHHKHHSKIHELEVDSSVILGFLACCALALLYKKRKKLHGYLLRLKYYLCCCRLSEEEILGQEQDEHGTLNDFLFEVDGNEETGRVNVSGLTNDEEGGGGGGGAEEISTSNMPKEISIKSVFPDLLGDELSKQPNNSNNNSLQEPLIPRQNS